MLAAVRAARVGLWSCEWPSGASSWSPETEKLFGVKPGEFPGTIEAYLGYLADDDRGPMERIVSEAVEKKLEGFPFAHWVIPGDGGSRRWIEGWGSVLLDESGEVIGVTGAVIDNTARKRAELDLSDRKRELELVAELSSDYVYEADATQPDLFPRIVAGSFERTTGYTPDEVKRAGGWTRLILDEDMPQVAQVMEETARGKPIVATYRIRDRNGGVRWLRDRITPVFENGRPHAFVGGVQDVTEYKELEAQLHQAQKMEALAHLSGSVAHDFNNLLTVMMASAEMLKAPRGGTHDQAALEDLNAAIDRAAELARSLLAFGRRQVGRLRSLDLTSAVISAERMLSRAVGEGIELRTEFEIAGPLFVRGDPGQLELVLLNLCINARDAAPSDHLVRVGVRRSEFGKDDAQRPAELAEGVYAEVFVADRGHGMDVQTRLRAFEPFFTTKSEGRGTGLGLSSVHGIVTSWGGAIKAESTVGEGTTMRVYLPLTEPKSDSAFPSRPQMGSVGGTETLLLVEDEPLLRGAAARALSELGYRVFAYSSAEELLSALDECGTRAALVISDVRLPGMDGVELVESIKKTFPALRVLLISGHVELPSQQELIQSGKYSFLAKPFSVEGLARRVREILD